MNKLLKGRLRNLAAAYTGGMIAVIVFSLALGTNVIAGIQGTTIAYGMAWYTYYFVTVSRNQGTPIKTLFLQAIQIAGNVERRG